MPNFSSTGIPKSFSTGLLSVCSSLSFGTGDCPDPGALVLAEACEGHMGLLLRPARVPVGSIPSLQELHCTAHPGVLCQLPAGASHYPCLCRYWRDGTVPISACIPEGCLVTDLHLDVEPLNVTLWVMSFNQFLSCQTVHPFCSVVWDTVRGLTEVKSRGHQLSFLALHHSQFTIECH